MASQHRQLLPFSGLSWSVRDECRRSGAYSDPQIRLDRGDGESGSALHRGTVRLWSVGERGRWPLPSALYAHWIGKVINIGAINLARPTRRLVGDGPMR